MTTEQIIALITAIGPILVAIVGALLAYLKVSDEKKAMIGRLVTASYHMATEVAALTPNKADDIVAVALGELSKGLNANGLKLTPAIAEAARLSYNAMSGAEKQAVEIIQKAGKVPAEVAQPDPTKAPALG